MRTVRDRAFPPRRETAAGLIEKKSACILGFPVRCQTKKDRTPPLRSGNLHGPPSTLHAFRPSGTCRVAVFPDRDPIRWVHPQGAFAIRPPSSFGTPARALAHIGSLEKFGIDLVVVGADRIARNGDTANKIGTYNLAIAARYHGIPFYVAAPTSTIDLDTPSSEAIPIEERRPEEVTHCGPVRVVPEGSPVYNPAFDVTPAELITAIITEKGVVYPPFPENLVAVMQASEGLTL